jgi:hypothetical protein
MPPSRLEQRGVRAIVTTRGAGMRWPLGLRETNATLADVKSCGPGTPTLVSSRQVMILLATVANKPGTPGRARYKRLKLPRRGCRMFG